jgi:hypothetical protein
MPRQLANGLWLKRQSRRKHSEPKPLVELLPRVDIGDLCRWRVFPSNWHTSHYFEMPFRLNFIKHLVISLGNVEAIHYSGYNQIIPLRWCPTGFGGLNRQRPLFICNCGRSVTKLYFTYGSLKCRRCSNSIYASQACDQHSRPALQAHRIRQFIKAKPRLTRKTKQQLRERYRVSNPTRMPKRVTGKALLPTSNYQAQAEPLYR